MFQQVCALLPIPVHALDVVATRPAIVAVHRRHSCSPIRCDYCARRLFQLGQRLGSSLDVLFKIGDLLGTGFGKETRFLQFMLSLLRALALVAQHMLLCGDTLRRLLTSACCNAVVSRRISIRSAISCSWRCSSLDALGQLLQFQCDLG